jgi:hypothetical protein
MLYLGSWSGTSTYSNKWSIYQESTTEKNYFGSAVLIGTNTNSGYKLDVSGTGRFTGALTGTSATFSSSVTAVNSVSITGSYPSISLNATSGTNFYIESTFTSNRLGFGIVGNAPIMAITSGGNVGIGTSSPTETLVLSKATYPTIKLIETTDNASGYFQYHSDTNEFRLVTITSHPLIFSTNDTERMRITSTGNVGIGTDVPQTYGSFAVRKATSISGSNVSASFSDAANSTFDIRHGVGGSGNVVDLSAQGGALTFSAGSAERMRITSAGQIQETTSIADWSHTIRNTSSSSPNGMLISYDNANKNNTGNQFLYCVDNFGGSLRMSVRSNGGIENYATNNIPLSDERLKKDITPLESVWDKIKNIEIVKYKFKDQTHDDFNMGVIAQQVQKVAPELVDDEGWGTFAEDGTTYKGIWETDLNYYSIKALQEAMAKIESLQEQINELKNK